jgi:ABC-type branched-subunit amino acid transport system substrate-binding protein
MRTPGRLRVGACLSLSGRYARFGRQAAQGLAAWQSLDGAAELIVEDDGSDPGAIEAALRGVARRCDVLLGPYSTQLTRVAGQVAAEAGCLLWNHGGSGDDVQEAHPGHVVSVLTPASRYAEPFITELAAGQHSARLLIVQGKGSFGTQVAAGAEESARRLGVEAARIGPSADLPVMDKSAPWDLFCAGAFEHDVGTVERARALPRPPRLVCAVAAGVREFASAAGDVEGVYGVGQWFPGAARTPDIGPAEADFLAAYSALFWSIPDYPAVQAAAGAALASHCARHAGEITRDSLWRAASALDAQTLFGGFLIRPDSGVQVKHETVLVRWTAGVLTRAGKNIS